MTASGHTHLHEKKGSEEHMVPLCLGCAEKIVAADAKKPCKKSTVPATDRIGQVDDRCS